MIYAKATDFTCNTAEEYKHLYSVWTAVMAGDREMDDDEFEALCNVLETYEDSKA